MKIFEKMLLGAGLAILASTGIAHADGWVIWGRQTGLGEFMTDKVNLNKAVTVTGVTYDGAGDGFCIWSGVPTPSAYLCWNTGDPSLVGTTLPPDRGYFAIPDKRTVNSPAYVQITVE